MDAPRSGFVTGLAWTFIVLAGFATLMTLLQNIMLAVMFPVEEMRAMLRESEKSQPMPALFRFMFEHFRFFFGLMFAVCAVTFVSAIGLLRRKNWARIIFVILMVLSALWNLASIAMPFYMFSSFPVIPDGAAGGDEVRLMINIMIGFMVVIGILFAGLFAWIAKRLMSDDIKREFAVS